MIYRNCLYASLLVLALLALGGCARAARDTTGFALEETITVEAPFIETWQIVKSVLREQGFDVYTRDKRGSFVAFTPMKRRYLVLTPNRIKYSLELVADSPEETTIYIETVKQVYGVTLLTYPDWHDRRIEDESTATAILEAIQARVAGEEAPPAADTEMG